MRREVSRKPEPAAVRDQKCTPVFHVGFAIIVCCLLQRRPLGGNESTRKSLEREREREMGNMQGVVGKKVYSFGI